MTDPTAPLTDFATLAFVIAHGADADLDVREVGTLTRRVESLAGLLSETPISGVDLSEIVRAAGEAYSGLAVTDAPAVLDRLGRALDPTQRAEVYAALVEIAAADGSILTMEQTFLRHIALAWELG